MLTRISPKNCRLIMITRKIITLIFEARKYLGLIRNIELAHRYPQYQIGPGTYGDLKIRFHEGASLKIGAYTSIASNVRVFLGGEHRTDWVTTYPFNIYNKNAMSIEGHPKSKGNVEIGNDVWIGTDAIILSGVKIGDGAVIGAGAVVARDVPPYAIAVGNPARIIKLRFSDEVIDKLLSIQWWNWPSAQIEKAIPDLLSQNIEQFIQNSIKVNNKK